VGQQVVSGRGQIADMPEHRMSAPPTVDSDRAGQLYNHVALHDKMPGWRSRNQSGVSQAEK